MTSANFGIAQLQEVSDDVTITINIDQVTEWSCKNVQIRLHVTRIKIISSTSLKSSSLCKKFQLLSHSFPNVNSLEIECGKNFDHVALSALCDIFGLKLLRLCVTRSFIEPFLLWKVILLQCPMLEVIDINEAKNACKKFRKVTESSFAERASTLLTSIPKSIHLPVRAIRWRGGAFNHYQHMQALKHLNPYFSQLSSLSVHPAPLGFFRFLHFGQLSKLILTDDTSVNYGGEFLQKCVSVAKIWITFSKTAPTVNDFADFIKNFPSVVKLRITMTDCIFLPSDIFLILKNCTRLRDLFFEDLNWIVGKYSVAFVPRNYVSLAESNETMLRQEDIVFDVEKSASNNFQENTLINEGGNITTEQSNSHNNRQNTGYVDNLEQEVDTHAVKSDEFRPENNAKDADVFHPISLTKKLSLVANRENYLKRNRYLQSQESYQFPVNARRSAAIYSTSDHISKCVLLDERKFQETLNNDHKNYVPLLTTKSQDQNTNSTLPTNIETISTIEKYSNEANNSSEILRWSTLSCDLSDKSSGNFDVSKGSISHSYITINHKAIEPNQKGPIEAAVVTAVQKNVEKAIENTAKKALEKAVEKAVEKSVEKAAENAVEIPEYKAVSKCNEMSMCNRNIIRASNVSAHKSIFEKFKKTLNSRISAVEEKRCRVKKSEANKIFKLEQICSNSNELRDVCNNVSQQTATRNHSTSPKQREDTTTPKFFSSLACSEVTHEAGWKSIQGANDSNNFRLSNSQNMTRTSDIVTIMLPVYIKNSIAMAILSCTQCPLIKININFQNVSNKTVESFIFEIIQASQFSSQQHIVLRILPLLQSFPFPIPANIKIC